MTNPSLTVASFPSCVNPRYRGLAPHKGVACSLQSIHRIVERSRLEMGLSQTIL